MACLVSMRLPVAVLGGGLGGCSAAIGLQAVGAEVAVCEAAAVRRRVDTD